MDRIDFKLLDALQRDASVTNLALAETVGLSPSSCLRRVQRLESDGVVQRTVALVDPAALGRPLTAIIEVELERHGARRLEAFLRRATAEAAVTHLWAVSGDVDVVLLLRLVDMAEFNALADRLLRDEDHVARFRTLFVTQTAKENAVIPPNPALTRR